MSADFSLSLNPLETSASQVGPRREAVSFLCFWIRNSRSTTTQSFIQRATHRSHPLSNDIKGSPCDMHEATHMLSSLFALEIVSRFVLQNNRRTKEANKSGNVPKLESMVEANSKDRYSMPNLYVFLDCDLSCQFVPIRMQLAVIFGWKGTKQHSVTA